MVALGFSQQTILLHRVASGCIGLHWVAGGGGREITRDSFLVFCAVLFGVVEFHATVIG